MKYFVPAFLCFLGLVGVSLAGSPPTECPEACKPVQVKVVEVQSCAGAKESCAGAKRESCSGRTTFAQRRADRQECRQEARATRAASRNSCCGQAATQVVVVESCTPLCESGCKCNCPR